MFFEERLHLLRTTISGPIFLLHGVNSRVRQQVPRAIFIALQVTEQALTITEIEAEMTQGLRQSILVLDPACVGVHFDVLAWNHWLHQTLFLALASRCPDTRHVEIERLAVREFWVIRVAVPSVVRVECLHDGSGLLCCRYVLVESAAFENAPCLEDLFDSSLTFAGSLCVVAPIYMAVLAAGQIRVAEASFPLHTSSPNHDH